LQRKAEELRVELDTHVQARDLPQPVSGSNVVQGHEPESAEPYDDAPDEEAKVASLTLITSTPITSL